MQYLNIKDVKIPIIIQSYKNSKSIKIYFKGNTLKITKPKKVSISSVMKMIEREKDNIYDKYKNVLDSKVSTSKQWIKGEKLYYKGEPFEIIRLYPDTRKISVELSINKKQIVISTSKDISQEEIKINVDKLIKKVLKNHTEIVIAERLPYWSGITGINYNQVKVRDAITRYGSCMPSKKNLYFSARLVMLPEDKIDAIIVHELCHMKYKNHNKEFYNLVSQYIPNYKEIDKWLKENGKIILF